MFVQTYSLRAKDIDTAMACMEQVISNGYHSERDLFVARLCFEVLIRFKKGNEAQVVVPKVLNHFYQLDATFKESPILNFV